MGQQAEEQFVEDCKHLLYHAESNLELANTMEEYCGYTTTKIEYGKGLVKLSQACIRQHRKAVFNSKKIRTALTNNIKHICRQYSAHRRKARVLFRDNNTVFTTLALADKVPKTTKEKLEFIHKFYLTIKKDYEIQKTLKQMNISYMDIFTLLTTVDEINEIRVTYLHSLKEINQSNLEKKRSLEALKKWSDRYINSGRKILGPYPMLQQLIEI